MIPEPASRPEAVVYLIRHGETAWNAEGRFQGNVDTPLSALGRAQAEAAGRRLAGSGLRLVLSSDLARARQTAAAVAAAAACELRSVRAFREVDVGRWEGLTFAEVREAMPDSFAEWQAGRPGFRFPGGETWEEGAQRALDALDSAISGGDERTLAVVSHGGLLRAVIYSVLGMDHARRGLLQIDNAGLSAIAGGPGRWRVILLNDTCHLSSIRRESR